MRLKLAAGERVIVRTRRQPRSLFWPTALLLLLIGAASFTAGRLSRADQPEWAIQWRPWLLGGTAAVVLFLLLRACLRPFLRWWCTSYILTNRRLIVRYGVLRKHWREVPLMAVWQLHITSSIFQRPLRSGTLSVDMGHGRGMSFVDVPELERFRGLVLAAIEGLPQTAMFDGVDMERVQDADGDGTGNER